MFLIKIRIPCFCLMPSPSERPTLESLFEQEFVEATSQNQTLIVRTYLRWKIISAMVGVSFDCDLETFVDVLHHAQGLSVRDIAKALSDIMSTFFADRHSFLENAIHIAEDRTDLILQDLQLDVAMRRALIETALHGSPRPGYNFDLEHRLTHISKNAAERLMRLLQISMRDYSERHAGYGYRAKKRTEMSRRSKANWRDPRKRSQMIAALIATWKVPHRKTRAAETARDQMTKDPDKVDRMLAGRGLKRKYLPD